MRKIGQKNLLNKEKENLIEVTIVFIDLFRSGAIKVYDFTNGKYAICDIAAKFGELFDKRGDEYWVEEDYQEKIADYARTRLIEIFSN